MQYQCQINPCNSSYQQAKDENHVIISINSVKAFDIIEHTFTIKNLKISAKQEQRYLLRIDEDHL